MAERIDSDHPEQRHSALRRNAFATVLVLVAVLPFAVFALTYSLNKASARLMLEDRLLESVQNAQGLKREVERSLALAEDAGLVSLQTYRPTPDGSTLYDTFVTPAFRQELSKVEPRDEMLGFATLLNARGETIAGFGEGGETPRQGDVQVMPDETDRIIVQNIITAAGGSGKGVITVAFPTRIGRQIAGTLIVGFSFERLHRRTREQTAENNSRALRISIVGSLLLAVLGAYLLKLTDNARRLQSALEKRKHLAYIGTISAGLAHEIRNPLSSMKMNVQMIRNSVESLQTEDRDRLLRKLERVAGETDRLEQAMNDFLVFAAPRPLRMQPTDLNALVQSVVENTTAAGETAEVAAGYAPGLPPMQLDQDMFVQMLRNLLINALQAAGPTGSVEVETLAEGGDVVVAVSDSGPGVPADLRGKIFDVFFTTKKAGTGLGLNIAKRIVEDHQGSIELAAAASGGAKFIVRLPAHPERHL